MKNNIKKYDPGVIEKKWQDKWDESEAFKVLNDVDKLD